MRLASLISHFQDWRERREVTAELRRLEREDEPYRRADIEVLLDAVKQAAFCGDPEATLKAFNVLRSRAPDVAISSRTAIYSLIDVGKVDLAESLITEGLRKYRGDHVLMLLYAEVAHRRHDWPETNRRFELLRQKFPDDIWGYTWGAVALRELGQLVKAEKLLARAIAIAPLHNVAAREYARIAEQRGDAEEALRRWGLMRDRIEDQTGWVEAALLSWRLGREDEAIGLLTKARWRFQNSPEPAIELARICYGRGSLEEATNQWQSVREQFPHDMRGYTEGAQVLRELGQHEEADTVLRRYAARSSQSN
jgi:predicted Zn-dependent protease